MFCTTRHAWSPKATPKSLDSTLQKCLHPLFELNLSAPYSLLLRFTDYIFSMPTQKQRSSTETVILNFMLNSLKDSLTGITPIKPYAFENRFMASNKLPAYGTYFFVNICSTLASNAAIQTPASTLTLRKALFCLYMSTIFSFSVSISNPAKRSFNSCPHNSEWKISGLQPRFSASILHEKQTQSPSIEQDTSSEC